MATMEVLGTELKRLPPAVWYPQTGPQSLAYLSTADELFFGGSAGGGKCLDVCTPIPTINGWVELGKIQSGDSLFTPEGGVCLVTKTYAPFKTSTYRLTFDDGTTLDACDDHKWVTFNERERLQLLQFTPKWRESRRLKRPSRSVENSKRSTLLTIKNKEKTHTLLAIPQGSVRTTRDIRNTLLGTNGRANHAVKICDPAPGKISSLPLDPYLFGIWLGDGSSYKAEITTADPFIIQQWESGGFRVSPRGSKYAYGVNGLLTILKSMEVISNKHIPYVYLWAEKSQRLNLLKGLMDTDGCVRKHAGVEFTTTNKNLAEGVRHLIVSLGWKCCIREGRATLYGKDCGPKYRIVFSPNKSVFRLPRKRDEQRLGSRQTNHFRYIKSCEYVGEKVVRCISVDSPNKTFLAGTSFIPTHNSDLLLGLALTAHINSLILRLQSTQLTGFKQRLKELTTPGDRFQGIGPHGGIFRMHEGRTIELNGCETFSDAVSKFRGRAHDAKLWDELPTIPENVYTFVNGWNRTTVVGQRCRVVGAGNPPSRPEEEWVLDYWAPWLRDFSAEPGQILWFIRVENKWVQVEDDKPVKVGKETIFPRSRTFIPARLEDNPILERTGYRQNLINLPEPYKSQLLYGDMKIGLIDDARQLIPTEWVRHSQRRWIQEFGDGKMPSDSILKCSACDPARGGMNRNILAKRYYSPSRKLHWVAPLNDISTHSAPDGPSLANRIILFIESRYPPLIIDITGTAGGGLLDSMRILYPHIPSYAFVAAAASKYLDRSGRIRMRNKRTEAYWRLRDALDPMGDMGLLLPPGNELRMEVTAGRWYMYTSGAGIEEKEEIASRLGGNSPDLADAVAMTMMEMDATGGWVPEQQPHSPHTFMGVDMRARPAQDVGQKSYRDPWS